MQVAQEELLFLIAMDEKKPPQGVVFLFAKGDTLR